MATYDARPSAFTQLSSTQGWEFLHSALGGLDAVDGFGALNMSFDVPGRNIVVTAGAAAIRGQLWRADASVSTPIPAASGQNRLDRLVLRLNRGATTSATVVVPTVITGTPSGSPVLPAITQTPTGIWDMQLCYWTSASSGALSGITDDRQQIVNDSWHTIAAPVNWTGGVNYKMLPGRAVALAGQIQLPSTGSYNNVTIATVPANYRPQGDKFMACACTSLSSIYGQNSGSPGLPRVHVATNGAIQVSGFPAGVNNDLFYIDGLSYPLDF